MFKLIWNIFLYLLNELRIFFHTYWILGLKWIANPFWSYPSYPFYHHLIFVGDEYALGKGDWCIPGQNPGCSGRILPFLKSFQRLRHTWKPLNYGKFKTLTSDWLPPSNDRSMVKGKLFQTYFEIPSTHALKNRIELQQAKDMVVLCLGSNDLQQGVSPQQIVHHLKDIALKLASKFAFVYICTIPNWIYDESTAIGDQDQRKSFKSIEASVPQEKMALLNSNSNSLLAASKETNQLLRAWIQGLGKDSNIRLGAEIDRENLEYRLSKLYFSDMMHFSSYGYRKMAKDLAIAMEYDCRKVEFREESKLIK